MLKKPAKLRNLVLSISATALLCSLGTTTGLASDVLPDTWVAVDALGRNVASSDSGVTREIGNIDTTTQVGMFYYLSQGMHAEEMKDNTRLLEANPVSPAWGYEYQPHWAGKPLLGYYKGNDPFIIAKNMQMLMDAGIDFYFFDTTNAVTYDNNVRAVMAEIDRREALGLKVPKLVYTLHSQSATTAKHIYDEFFGNYLYDKYWWNWKGKPLLLSDRTEWASMTDEIRNRFTLRHCWAWDGGEDSWPWVENYPQKHGTHLNLDGVTEYEQLSVSVAQHPMSKIGKSYHNGSQPAFDVYGLCKETPYGYYFLEQWQEAFANRPKVLMITQWNEWVAQRFVIHSTAEFSYVRPGATAKIGESYFVDVYNQEFSRDLEPSSEPLIIDNYYMLLCSQMRKFRGVNKIPVPTVAKTINIGGDFSQWDDVTSEFADEPGDTYYTKEDAMDTETLEHTTNDIVLAKVTKDNDSIYFYVEAASDLTELPKLSTVHWMSLLLNTDCNYSTGWAGYDYKVMNNVGNVGLFKVNAADTTWNLVATVNYKVEGKKYMFAVAKADLGLTGEKDFDFKWIDNVKKTCESPLSFYANGDCAPNWRFNYRYKGSQLASSAVASVKTDATLSAWCSGGNVYMQCATADGEVQILDAMGRLIAHRTVQAGTTENFAAPAGVLIVRSAAGKAIKLTNRQ